MKKATPEVKVDNGLSDADFGQLLEEIDQAEQAPEPGTMRTKDIIHRGDDDLPISIVTGALKSAGYVYVWDTRTFERSVVNRNQLLDVLKKRRDDGSKVFTTRKPAQKPHRGEYKCMLHPDNPNRAAYDAMGLPVCRKEGINSPYQQLRHMQMKHPSELKAIEDMEKRKDDELERKFKEALIAKAG